MLALFSSLFLLFFIEIIHHLLITGAGGGRNPFVFLIIPFILSSIYSFVIYTIKKRNINSSEECGVQIWFLTFCSGLIYYKFLTDWTGIFVVPLILFIFFTNCKK